jgi:hypothetical protein
MPGCHIPQTSFPYTPLDKKPYRNEGIVVHVTEVDGHCDGGVGEALTVVGPGCVALVSEPLPSGEAKLRRVRLRSKQTEPLRTLLYPSV